MSEARVSGARVSGARVSEARGSEGPRSIRLRAARATASTKGARRRSNPHAIPNLTLTKKIPQNIYQTQPFQTLIVPPKNVAALHARYLQNRVRNRRDQYKDEVVDAGVGNHASDVVDVLLLES